MQKITAKFFRSGMQRCIAKYAFPLAFSLFSACGRQAKQEITLTNLITGGMYLAGLGAGGLKGFGADGAVRGSLGWGLGVYPKTPQTTASTATTTTFTPDVVSVLNSMEDGEMDYNTFLEELKANKRQANRTGIIKHRAKNNATATVSPGGAGKKVLYIDSFPIGLHHVTFGGKCMQVAGTGEGTQSTSVAVVPGSDARVNKLDGLDLTGLTPACAGVLQEIGEELCDGQPQGAKGFMRCDYDRSTRKLRGGIMRKTHKPRTQEPEDGSNPKLPKKRLKKVCDEVVGCSAPAKERGREQNRGSGGSSTTESSAKSNKRPSNHRALPQQLPDQSRPTRAASANETAAPMSTTPTPKNKKRKKKKLFLVKNGVYGYGNKLELTESEENSDLPDTDVEVQGAGSIQGDDNEVKVHIRRKGNKRKSKVHIGRNGAPPAVGDPAVYAAGALATTYAVRKYCRG